MSSLARNPWYWTAVALCTVGAVVALALRSPQGGQMDEVRDGEHLTHPLPAWTLTDQNGQPFGSAQLLGHPYVANFVFTRCVASCPRMTRQMATLQQHLRDLRGRLALVSITIDPVNDTAERLHTYGEHAGADFTFWHFLTGPEGAVGSAVQEGFLTSVHLPAGGLHSEYNPLELSHAERFAVVDARGVMRGSYVATDEGLARLEQAVRTLAAP